jgi:hypothetical protein
VESAVGSLGPAAAHDKQKSTNLSVPVKFGSLPLAGDKKVKEEEEMRDGGEEEVEDENMVL